MILSSNIIILAADPTAVKVRAFLATGGFAASDVSLVEVLGYHKLTLPTQYVYERIFKTLTLMRVTPNVVRQATLLRRLYRLDLGDSIIAATAVTTGRTLATNNTADFANVAGLSLFDPT